MTSKSDYNNRVGPGPNKATRSPNV